MGMVAREIEELCLQFAAGVDVGMRRQVIRNVIVRHAGCLLVQLVADQRETVAVERRPHFFNVAGVLVGRGMWLANRERIERDGHDTFQRAKTIRGCE